MRSMTGKTNALSRVQLSPSGDGHDVDDDAAEPPERVERDERPGPASFPGDEDAERRDAEDRDEVDPVERVDTAARAREEDEREHLDPGRERARPTPNQRWRRAICRRETAYEPTIRQRKAKASGLKPTVRAAKTTASQSRRNCSSLSVASIAAKPSVYA